MNNVSTRTPWSDLIPVVTTESLHLRGAVDAFLNIVQSSYIFFRGFIIFCFILDPVALSNHNEVLHCQWKRSFTRTDILALNQYVQTVASIHFIGRSVGRSSLITVNIHR